MSAASLTQSSHAAANWAPSRRLTLDGARRRSRRVRVYRAAFLALSVAAAMSLVGALAGNALDRSGSRRAQLEGSEVVTMLNPRFSGRDAFGRPFVLTADTAQRQRASEGRIELVNPRLVDNQNRVVSAPRGLYDQDSQFLELFEDVVAEEADGYVFRTTQAKIFVTESRVEGVEPLTGGGPIGDIRADTYEILEDGASIRFKGRVKTTLYPDGRPSEGGG